MQSRLIVISVCQAVEYSTLNLAGGCCYLVFRQFRHDNVHACEILGDRIIFSNFKRLESVLRSIVISILY